MTIIQKMKCIVLLLTVLVNVVDISEAESHSSVYVKHKPHFNLQEIQNTAQLRSPRQWMATNYDQTNPSHQHHGHYYNNPQEALLTEIVSLLQDIKLSLASQKQHSPCQPIYVPYPYPVPYSVPQYIHSYDDSTFRKIDATKNSSIVVHNDSRVDDNDGNDFTKSNLSHSGTEVLSSSNKSNHSEDENIIHFPEPPAVLTKDEVSQPSKCESATFACCKYSQSMDQEKCFLMHNCSQTNATKLACKKEVLDTIVQKLIETYAPIEET
ncbi:unnamed protein product [Parnassius apollo]|uniref:(apollo) hypothetical protein n=1 Tax=Parnassius apollo TaxID=110799 RepID=A0A8S3X227_PARAO|nr:unnamed protein product [Parnassius apollo]